jgi:hypothetical protein
VYLVDQLFRWTNQVLAIGEFALWLWAFADCATRKSAAFPAADKLTKPAWLAILAIATLFGYLTARPFDVFASPANGVVPLVASIAAGVYLADVRPAVREISGGR